MQSTGKIVMAFGEPCLNLIQTQGKKKQCPFMDGSGEPCSNTI